MASKKTNGFMVFTKEWKSKQRGECNLQTAIDEAGKTWAKMTPQQRGPYNERAKKDNVFICKERELRNCNGIPLSQIDRENKEIKNRELKMQRFIDNVIREALNNNEIQNLPFYFIMFNYFTKTADGSMYIPAEVAVCRYSLEGGQMDLYSSLLNPATEIFGSSYDAMTHATNTHKLPLPPQALGNKDLVKVYCDILQFLRKDGAVNKANDAALPPVYTFNEHIPIVDSCLKYLYMLAPDEPTLSVYSVHYLFYKLKHATCELAGIDPPKSNYITDAQFNRDFFEYQSGIACEYHEDIDRAKYCAQSRVIRWSYIFSDYMCRDLDIELIEVHHVPLNLGVNYIVTDSNGNSTWNTSVASSKFKSAASTIDTGNEEDIKANSSRIGSLSLNNTDPTTDASSYALSADTKPWQPQFVMSDTFNADLTGNDFPVLSANKKSKKKINTDYVQNATTVFKDSVWNLPEREPTLLNFNTTMSTIHSDRSSIFGQGRGRRRGADSSRSFESSVDGKSSLRGMGRGSFYPN